MNSLADRFISHRSPDDDASLLYNTKLELFSRSASTKADEDVEMNSETRTDNSEEN